MEILKSLSLKNFKFQQKFIYMLITLCLIFILYCDAYYIDNNAFRHKHILGPNASFVVAWKLNWKEKSITFQVSAQTKGWIGFGLSRDGRMIGSDVVVGGVSSSGKPYFEDAHVKGNRSVQADEQQDWELIGAWEKGTRTYLSFKRPFDTCDLRDYPITNDLIVLIWAYGETDTVSYHMKRRGSYPIYLLDPEITTETAHHQYRQIGPHSNTVLVQRWAIKNTLRLPARPTSVWCSVHQGPSLNTRHDITGIGAFLPNYLARRHVHHMLLYKCTTPQQTVARTFFEPYAQTKGEECYMNDKRTLPLSFCRDLIYAWARGGKPFYFPEDIGIPIGESPNEYYLLETHYDNPKNSPKVELEAGIEIIFSHRTKANQASLLQIGYGPFGMFMIPPGGVMNVYGSCGPECTSRMFPKKGVSVFAAMLHSHSLGRRIRLQHFRGNEELPWILKDDNYDSEFQQMRLLPEYVTLLPGDHLTTQCTFDSSERDRTSFSGFSLQDETCLAFVYVSRRIPFFRCTSEYPADRQLARYGVRNFTWDINWHDRYVTVPKQMDGTWLGDVVDDDSHSRPDMERLQQELQFGQHFESCPSTRQMMADSQNQLFKVFTNNWNQQNNPEPATETPYLSSSVAYPQNAREYHEASSCPNGHHHQYQSRPVKEAPEPRPTPPPKTIVDFSFSQLPASELAHLPPLQPLDANFLNNGRPNQPIRIPMIQMKTPNPPPEEKTSFFDQLASVFLNPSGGSGNAPKPAFKETVMSPKAPSLQRISLFESVMKKIL